MPSQIEIHGENLSCTSSERHLRPRNPCVHYSHIPAHSTASPEGRRRTRLKFERVCRGRRPPTVARDLLGAAAAPAPLVGRPAAAALSARHYRHLRAVARPPGEPLAPVRLTRRQRTPARRPRSRQSMDLRAAYSLQKRPPIDGSAPGGRRRNQPGSMAAGRPLRSGRRKSKWDWSAAESGDISDGKERVEQQIYPRVTKEAKKKTKKLYQSEIE